MKKCRKPEKNMTGFNPLSIDKTLTVSEKVQKNNLLELNDTHAEW